MKQTPEFLPLSVQARLQEVRPAVTIPSYETAQAVLRAMNMFSAGNKATKDEGGKVYWYASIKQLVALIGNETISHKMIGQACSVFQLGRRRENDGWHVAWSQAQLDILNQYVK